MRRAIFVSVCFVMTLGLIASCIVIAAMVSLAIKRLRELIVGAIAGDRCGLHRGNGRPFDPCSRRAGVGAVSGRLGYVHRALVAVAETSRAAMKRFRLSTLTLLGRHAR